VLLTRCDQTDAAKLVAGAGLHAFHRHSPSSSSRCASNFFSAA
jgi:hypothetical protein